jgi:hypothetical protein
MQTTGDEQEGQRSQVPGAFLDRIIQTLHEYVQGSFAQLVFNLDEVGISDLDDRKTQKGIAFAAMPSMVRRYIMEYLQM